MGAHLLSAWKNESKNLDLQLHTELQKSTLVKELEEKERLPTLSLREHPKQCQTPPSGHVLWPLPGCILHKHRTTNKQKYRIKIAIIYKKLCAGKSRYIRSLCTVCSLFYK